ncbi:MAG: hypothetical protein ACUVX8_02045 [Candidatus Zipacnadales bacterium]
MTTIRRNFGRQLSLLLVGALLITVLVPPGAVISSQAVAQAGAKTILAFPVEDESEDGSLGEVASRVTSALAFASREGKGVDLEVFSETSPMVRRALADGSLRAAEVQAPKDPIVALTIARAVGVQAAVLMGVQSLKIEGEPRTAEILVMGTEYDVGANVDPDTGAIAAEPTGNTFGISGVAKARGKADADTGLIRLAAKNAAYKIMHVLSGGTAEEYMERGAEPKKRSNLWRWVAIALVAGALVAATSGGDGDKVGPAVDDLIPTQRSARPTTDGIRLTWVRPATTLTIFKYQIQRSADGGVFVRIDNDRVGPTATSFTDYTVSSGTAYVYQIRVLYTNGTQSPWVSFNQIVVP